jgi:hypothetical protein
MPPECYEIPPEATSNWRLFSTPFHHCLHDLRVKRERKVDDDPAS